MVKTFRNLSLKQSKQLMLLLYGGGALMLVAAAAAWWAMVYNSPERIFWDMIDNSLRTSGVTRRMEQETAGQKAEQLQQIQFGAENLARSLTIMKQGKTEVTTETISTPSDDYVRYTKFTTDQKNASGKPFDMSNVIGVWTKSDEGSQFNRNMFGLVPIVSVSGEQRRELVSFVKDSNVYTGGIEKAKKTELNDRPVYVYDVTVQPVAYVAYLKRLGTILGIEQFKTLDPAQYEGTQPEVVRLTVDAAARHLVRAEYVATGQVEHYSGYGVHITQDVPKDSISSQELQSRMQANLQ